MSCPSTSSSIPSEVRLVAAVSRLVDLHQSRRESGIYVPETQERAGYLLAVALLLLDTLRELEMDRGPCFVAISEVFEPLKKRILAVTAEELDFVIDSLAHEREIRYGVEDEKGGLVLGLTRESTPLIEKARGFSQIQLSENARLLLRVAAMKDSWLYSDIDAEKLVKAIERGQFNDIPRFCKLMILDIASKNKQLSSALERPTLAELRDLLIQDGAGIAQALRDATEVVKRACLLIFNSQTRLAFEQWKASSGAAYSIGNLQTEIELVMQNVEKLSRRFVLFLETAQRARTTGGEGIPFLSIIQAMTTPAATMDAERLEALFAGLMPWGLHPAFFHPSLLVGGVDFSFLEETKAIRPVSTFTLEPQRSAAQSRLMDFLLRNRALILGLLCVRPALLSELLAQTGFVLQADESICDFFGIYSAPEHLDGEGFHIVIGITGDRFDIDMTGNRFSGSDPLMFLLESDE